MTPFFVGAVLGSLTAVVPLWLVSGLTHPIPSDVRGSMLMIVALLTLLRDWEILRFRLPENRRQVPQTVFAKGRSRAALQFGFEMGTGVRTYVTATSPYLLASYLLLTSPSMVVALTAGVGFGFARGILPIMRSLAPDSREWDIALDRWSRHLVRACGVMACAIAVVLGARLL